MLSIRPRRSVLFVPGSSDLEKAQSLPCDVVVLGLEDAVAAEPKDKARVHVCAALANHGNRELVVRQA